MGDLAPQGARIPAPDQAPHENRASQGPGRTAWAQVLRRTAHSQRPGPYGRAWDHVAWRGTSGLCRPAGPAAHGQRLGLYGEGRGRVSCGVGSGVCRPAGSPASHGQRLGLYGEGRGRVSCGVGSGVCRPAGSPASHGQRLGLYGEGLGRVSSGVGSGSCRPADSAAYGQRLGLYGQGSRARVVRPLPWCTGVRAGARPVRQGRLVSRGSRETCHPAQAWSAGPGTGPRRPQVRAAWRGIQLVPPGTGCSPPARHPPRPTDLPAPAAPRARPHPASTWRFPTDPPLLSPRRVRRQRRAPPPRGSPHLCHPTCTGGAGGNRQARQKAGRTTSTPHPHRARTTSPAP